MPGKARQRLLILSLALGLLLLASGTNTAKILRWQLKPQQQYRITAKWTTRNATANLELTNTTSLQLMWLVKGVDEDGAFQIVQTMTHVKQSLQTPDGKIFQYDSQEAGDPKGSAAHLAAYWKPLIGVERNLKLSPLGSLLEVQESNPAKSGVKSGDNALISRSFDQATWRTALSQAYVVFPENSIEPSQSWVDVQSITVPFDQSTLKTTRIYVYRGEQPSEPASDLVLDVIDVTTRFESQPHVTEPSRLRIVQQDSSGELAFDSGAGHPRRSTYDQSLTLRWAAADHRMEMQSTTSFEMTFQAVPKSETVAGEPAGSS